MSQHLIDEIQQKTFTPVRFRMGYDMGEVDLLLDQLCALIGQGLPLADTIDAARFTTVRLREGYDIGEVDGFLRKLRDGA